MVSTPASDSHATRSGAALGLDAGGTATRWAVVGDHGHLLGEGSGAPITGVQISTASGLAQLDTALAGIARALPCPVDSVLAGVTGYDMAQGPLLLPRLAAAFGTPVQGVRAISDIELLCRTAFAPGAGAVLYAGTGSVAAHLDGQGQLHRAGGRGVVIDDAGGGHWIARQALKQVWRTEDATPGAWEHSALARALFERIGGHDWAATRAWVYGASRGELGRLAQAVAGAASQDARALALLEQAGRELARLVHALAQRFGALPLALAGRVFELHPAVQRALLAELPDGTQVQGLPEQPHVAAARQALQRA